MQTVWGTSSIQIPDRMLVETKNGYKLKDTITKRGRLATNNGITPFRVSSAPGHINILDQGDKLSLNNLQSVLKEEKKLLKNKSYINTLKRTIKDVTDRHNEIYLYLSVGGKPEPVHKKEVESLLKKYKSTAKKLKALTGEEYPALETFTEMKKHTKK